MSIIEIKMFGARCDNCQERFVHKHTGEDVFIDKETCRYKMIRDCANNWYEHKYKVNDNTIVKHYCPECYQIAHNGELMLNTKRHKEPKIYFRDECVFKICPTPNECKDKDSCKLIYNS